MYRWTGSNSNINHKMQCSKYVYNNKTLTQKAKHAMTETLVNKEKHEYIRKKRVILICIEVSIDILLNENKTQTIAFSEYSTRI